MHYRNKQRFYFIILLIDVFIFIGLGASLAFLPWSSDLKLVALVIIAGLLTFSTAFIYSYVQFYQTKYQYFTLREGAEQPLKTKVDLMSKSFLQKRTREGFSDPKSYGDFYLSYRYKNDKSSRFHRLGALEVIVVILNKNLAFDAPSIIEKINLVEDDLIYKKYVIQKYYIYTIKETDHLTLDQMSEANMVQFEQQKKRHITAINLYVEKEQQAVYFLHNNNFSPNAYYGYAVSQIKSWL